MIQEKNHRDSFRFNLSAFVSAAESVIDFLTNETNNSRSELNPWRTKQVAALSGDPFKKIINEQRRKTIHKEPLQPQTDVIVYPTVLKLQLEIQPVTVSQDMNDVVVSPVSVDNATVLATISKKQDRQIETTRSESTHYFRGHRDRDIISICGEHLDRLEKLIKFCEDKYKEFGALQ